MMRKASTSSLPITRRRSSAASNRPTRKKGLWESCICACGRYIKESCCQLRQFFVGELPSSLSVRTKVRIVLETRPLGHLWMGYQVLVTLMACSYFAASAYVPNAKGLMIEEMIFGASVVIDVIIRFYASDHRKSYFFEKSTIIDFLTVIPLLSDVCHLVLDVAPENGFKAPIYLRFVHVFKLLRILRVFNVGRQFSSPAIRQFASLILAVVCILYISAALINLAEGIPFARAVYFSIVTMATVGYGDITAVTSLGRFFVCCLICVSFIWVPYEINKLTQMLSLRSRYLTTFQPEADRPNVLLVGHLDAGKLSMFLTEFFHPDRRTLNNQASFYHVVILDNEEPNDEIVEVLEDPLIESRVTFIKGTLMDEDDLVRAGANCAVACFVFTDGLAADTEAADAITVLRVLVLKTFRPVLPCYVQLHHSHNRTQLHMLKKQRLVCIEDLKMSIMGLSALYPGFTTLLTNLLKSSVDTAVDTKLPPWQKEYIQGGDLEIYIIKLPKAFSGLRFDKAARDLYNQFNGKVSLLGVEERQLHVKSDANAAAGLNGTNYHVKRVLINPGSKYRINIQPPILEVWGYLLARNRHTAEKIQYLQVNQERIIPESPTGLSASKHASKKPSTRRFSGIMGEELESLDDENEDAAKDDDSDTSADDSPETLEDHRQEEQQNEGEQQQVQELQEPPSTRSSNKEWEITSNLIHEVPSSADKPYGRKASRVAFNDQLFTTAEGSSSGEGDGQAECQGSSNGGGGGGGSGSVASTTNPLCENLSFELTTLPRLASLEIGVTAVEDVRSMNLEDHIVIILPRAAEKLQCLLRPLRAHFLERTQYSKAIVILTEISLSQLEQHCNSLEIPVTNVRHSPDVAAPVPYDIYVVEGQTHKVTDLRRAGIETAYTCVILADRASVQEIDEEAVDESVIHQFVTIEKLRSRMDPLIRRPLSYCVEVLSIATLKILDQTYKTFKGKAKKHRSRRGPSYHFSDLRDRLSYFTSSSPIRHAMSSMGTRSPMKHQHQHPLHHIAEAATAVTAAVTASHENQEAIHTPGTGINSVDFGVGHRTMYPFVTAGTSFLIDVFDIISCQLFYNSDLIRFVDLLLALDHSSVSTSGTGHTRVTDIPPNPRDTKAISGGLGRIPVPQEAISHDYGYLFEMLMVDYEAMPIALYRHDAKADVYYVFTGPPPSTILHHTDHVFFLAPIHTIREVLMKYPPKPHHHKSAAGGGGGSAQHSPTVV